MSSAINVNQFSVTIPNLSPKNEVAKVHFSKQNRRGMKIPRRTLIANY